MIQRCVGLVLIPILLANLALQFSNICWSLPAYNTCLPRASNQFFIQFHAHGFANVIENATLMERVWSPYQDIEVFDSPFYGKFLVLDGDVMFTEMDESHYHEMMVHVPVNYFPPTTNLSVLIIGGGDGGAVRELLKHGNVGRIILVEIDEKVVQVCLKHLPRVAQGLNSPKVHIEYADGAKWVKTHKSERFHLILVDSTDMGPAITLHRDSFYLDCKSLLTEHGIVIKNFDSPSLALQAVSSWSRHWHVVFRQHYFYTVLMPSFAAGFYSFVLLSDDVHPTRTMIDWEAVNLKNISTHYYSKDVHYASFLLPQYMKEVVTNTVELDDSIPW